MDPHRIQERIDRSDELSLVELEELFEDASLFREELTIEQIEALALILLRQYEIAKTVLEQHKRGTLKSLPAQWGSLEELKKRHKAMKNPN